MFERFTDRARRVLVLAQEEARLLGHGYIGTEHLVLAMAHEGEGVAAKALDAHGLTLAVLRAKVEGATPRGTGPETWSPPFTPRSKAVLDLSLREALQLGHNYIGTEHLLLGLVREGEGVAAQAIVALGVPLAEVRQTVIQLLGGYGGEAMTAVDGSSVDMSDVPIGAGALLGSEEAAVLLTRWMVIHQEVDVREMDGVSYETYTYRPDGSSRTIAVAVVGASVTRQAFDAYSARIPDAEAVDDLGDAATYSAQRHALRVLCGATVIVVRVTDQPDPRAAAVEVARVAVANLQDRD